MQMYTDFNYVYQLSTSLLSNTLEILRCLTLGNRLHRLPCLFILAYIERKMSYFGAYIEKKVFIK